MGSRACDGFILTRQVTGKRDLKNLVGNRTLALAHDFNFFASRAENG